MPVLKLSIELYAPASKSKHARLAWLGASKAPGDSAGSNFVLLHCRPASESTYVMNRKY